MEPIENFSFVYVLKGQADFSYTGFSEHLNNRVKQHNRGEVQATKAYRPLELIFFEGYQNKYDALRRESYLKSSKGKAALRLMLKEYIGSKDKEAEQA